MRPKEEMGTTGGSIGASEHWSPARRWECLTGDDKLCWSDDTDDSGARTTSFVSRVGGGGIRRSQSEEVRYASTLPSSSSPPQLCFRVTGHVEVPDDPVTALASLPRSGTSFTAHKSGLVRIWRWKRDSDGGGFDEGGCFKAGHRSPVTLIEANAGVLFTSGPDLAFKVWEMETNRTDSINPKLRGTFKGGMRSVPICAAATTTTMSVNPKDTKEGAVAVVACGQVDGSVGLWGFSPKTESWNLEKRSRISKTVHNSQISCLSFVEAPSSLHTTGSGSKDQLGVGQMLLLVTCGRDRVMVWWNVEDGSCLRIVPVAETLEKLIPVPKEALDGLFKNWLPKKWSAEIMGGSSSCLLLSGGDKGQLRLWNTRDGKEVTCPDLQALCQTHCDSSAAIKDLHISRGLHGGQRDCLPQPEAGGNEVDVALHYLQGDVIVALSNSSSTCPEGETGVCVSMTSTGQHEIVDLALTASSRFLAVASSTNALRVYDLRYDPPVLSHVAHEAHSDSMLSLATFEGEDKAGGGSSYFMSTSKDQSVVLWRLQDPEKDKKRQGPVSFRWTLKALARGRGHTSFVGASAMTKKALFSASKDGLLKVWKWPDVDQEEQQDLESRRTIAAHSLEINTLASVEELKEEMTTTTSLVASGSQDKTVKVWRESDLSLVANLTGHRRGVWKCRFFNYENGPGSGRRLMLASASADCTVKLWDVATGFSCLHTMEGHQSSVLGLTAIGPGPNNFRLATVGSDGLLKVWSSSNSWTAAVGSFEAHEDKIWAVQAVRRDDDVVLITGGRDGEMVLWCDKTKEHLAQKRAEEEELVKTDQRLNNLLASGELAKALKLSIRLDRPRLIKQTLETLRRQDKGDLESALHKLGAKERGLLTKHLVQWNSFGSLSSMVQDCLQVLLMDGLMMANNSSSSTSAAVVGQQVVSAQQCAGLISYSEKHYKRLDKLHSRLAVVDLLLANM